MSDETEMPDLESVYDEQISPLMAQIIAICKEHRMPMLAQFRFSQNGMCTTALLDGPWKTEKMLRAYSVIAPQRHVALAETRVTDPATGRTTISIRRV